MTTRAFACPFRVIPEYREESSMTGGGYKWLSKKVIISKFIFNCSETSLNSSEAVGLHSAPPSNLTRGFKRPLRCEEEEDLQGAERNWGRHG
jgi:hypothetical protein